MGLTDIIYKYFDWIGSGILKMYPNIPYDIRRSGMRIHYEVYAAISGFLFLLSICLSLIILGILILIRLHPFVSTIIAIVAVCIPVLTLVMTGILLPKAISTNRSVSYDQEAPYAVAYLSVMATGGMSPYMAFERLGYAKKVFVRISQLAMRFSVLVKAIGLDPLTAFEDIAKRNPSVMLTDLVMGYLATLRAGGDVTDYLNKKAKDMFNALITKIRVAGDRMAVVLESYLAVVFIMLLAINAIYLVSLSIVYITLPGINEVSLFLVSYILLPFISSLIIYLADIVQYKEPGMIWGPYKVFFAFSLPILIFLTIMLVIPFYTPLNNPIASIFRPASNFIENIVESLGVDTVYASGVGLCIALLISSVPTAVYEFFVMGKQRKIATGVVRFLRDMVEVRKTGLPPERCIITLSNREYGVFSKYLREIASQIALGFPLGKIYDRITRRIKAWRARIFLYILTEAIEVGGGTPETLENMAYFAEITENLERERAASVRTLLLIPYIGAVVIISSIILMTSFMATLAAGIVAYRIAVKLIVPATIFNVYLMGLIAGKISAGSVAAGFKHAIFLTMISILTILASPELTMLLRGIAGG